MSLIRLYLDEDASRAAFVKTLRKNDIDVLTVLDTDRIAYSDEEQLIWATQQERVIYTFNTKDFCPLNGIFIAENREHPGIVVAPRQNYSIGEQLHISHGREVPKLLKSDINLSRLIVEVTESLLRYTLASFFILDLEKKTQEFEVIEVKEQESRIRYEENPEFNDLLDEEYPLDGKLLYSQALYTLYYEDYEIRLQTFLDEQAMLNEE
ncbi:MAG: DUF5615 family PIN-like protein [Cyanobacteria bacterium P01_A01_bin.84]